MLRVPDPIIFWACPAEDGTKFKVNPFDRVDLGWEGIFGPRTAFYQLHNGGNSRSLVREVNVPVLDLDSWAAEWVQFGTVACVLLGWGYIMLLLGRTGWKDWKAWMKEQELTKDSEEKEKRK